MTATALAAAMTEFRSMGTTVSVIAPAAALPRVVAGTRAVFDEWDTRFSRFRPDSELSLLNARAGSEVAVSGAMLEVVRAAVDAARTTGGLFDPLLHGRMVALGYDRTFADLPDDRAALASSPYRGGAWRAIVMDQQRSTIKLPGGVALDLGGIAKGMAVDAALARARETDLPFAAIDAGGDLAVHGLPPGQVSWAVAIDGQGERVVTISHGALATTSELRRRWRVAGQERHHLIDPRTGEPAATDVVQATVTGPTCRQAEVAAKAIMLLGTTGAAHFIDRNDLAALLLTRSGAELRMGRWHDH